MLVMIYTAWLIGASKVKCLDHGHKQCGETKIQSHDIQDSNMPTPLPLVLKTCQEFDKNTGKIITVK